VALLFFLGPLVAAAALTVLITGIVALAKNTPTWLRFRSRNAAIVATAVSAVVFFVAGMATSVIYPAAAEAGREAAPAPITAPLTPTAEAAPTATAEPVDEEITDEAFNGEVQTVTNSAATSELTALAVLDTLEVKDRAPKTG
jgi:hypothetical protein